MIAKYTIEYTIFPQHNKRIESHHTDDPVEAEDFLMYLLGNGSRIRAIKHEGVDLDGTLIASDTPRALRERRRDLVVLRLGGDAHFPEFRVEINHISRYYVFNGAEILVFKLLALGCGCTKDCPSGDLVAAARSPLRISSLPRVVRDGGSGLVQLLACE
mgnify:CR=1 FL=1